MNKSPLSPFRPIHDKGLAVATWMKQRWAFCLVFLVFIVLVWFFKFHHGNQKTEPRRIPVVTASVQKKDVPVYIMALGNVTPTYTVTVRTQINGLLMQVLYQEGQWVKKGDLLAEIDKRPLLAQLTQYEGQLKRDEALLANALIDLKRYQTLWKQDSISEQTLATQQSLVLQYQGSVETDKGLIQVTRVNLMYCDIRAPVDGRLGLRLVDPGNFVQTSDTSGLVVLTTLNPITVIFTIPEDDLQQLLTKVLNKKTINVSAYDRQQKHKLGNGTLFAMNNQIDTTTGTVKLRAEFSNETGRLFPNQFVNIKIHVTTLKDVMTIPTAAVQHGSHGDFVYLVNPEKNTVWVTPVTAGKTSEDITVITRGLTPGQQVVIDGADRLTDGAAITINKLRQTANNLARLFINLLPHDVA